MDFMKLLKKMSDFSLLSSTLPKGDQTFLLFSQVGVLQNISLQKRHRLYQLAEKVNLKKNEYLFQEGDVADAFYIIVDGEVEVLRKADGSQVHHQIALLQSGQTVGELGVLDHAPRSATVKAKTACQFLKIEFDALALLAKKDPEFHLINQYIYQSVSERLRHSNDVILSALERQLMQERLRVSMGTFMVYIFTALCVFTFSLAGLNQLSNVVSSTSFVSAPLLLLFGGAFCLLMKYSGLPLSAFGLTLKDWRPALKDAIFYTLFFMAFVVLFKWIEIQLFPSFAGHSLFESKIFFDTQGMPTTTHVKIVEVTSMLAYCLLIAPLQELMVRGGLQGPLEIFLTNRYKTIIAIVVSNLVFDMFHLYISIPFAFLVLVPGLFLGWLYSRHKTLVGVTVSHIMIGIWAFWIVGVW